MISIEALRDAYKSSSVFLNTSIHSPVPTVLMEAMACGCAVVSTDNCMIPEIIEHGVNGLLANTSEKLHLLTKESREGERTWRKRTKNDRREV